MDKLRKMSVEELLKYESAATTTNKLIAICGVSLILFTLFYPNIFVILATTILVFLGANISAGIDQFITVVQEQLEIKDK